MDDGRSEGGQVKLWSVHSAEARDQDEREFPLLAGTGGEGDGIGADDEQEVLGSAAI